MSHTTTPAEIEAETLISKTYLALGRCTISCSWCVGPEVYLDGDAVGNLESRDQVVALIEHARYSHVGAADVVASVVSTVLEVSR